MKKYMLCWLMLFVLLPFKVVAENNPVPEVQPIQNQGIEYRVEYKKTEPQKTWVTHKQEFVIIHGFETYLIGVDIASGRTIWKKMVYGTPGGDAPTYVKEMRLKQDSGGATIILTDINDIEHEVVINSEVKRGIKAGSLNAGMVTLYEPQEDGGRYSSLNRVINNYTFDQYVKLIRFNTFPLHLMPQSNKEWTEAFTEEQNKFIEIARSKQYPLVINKLTDKACPNRMETVVYNQIEKNDKIKLSNSGYKQGEKIEYVFYNASDFSKELKSITIQKWDNENKEWKEVNKNVLCGCSPCDYHKNIGGGEMLETSWDQMICRNEKESVIASPGKYRLHIPDLYQEKDEAKCTEYNYSIYSDSFTIYGDQDSPI